MVKQVKTEEPWRIITVFFLIEYYERRTEASKNEVYKFKNIVKFRHSLGLNLLFLQFHFY